MIVGRDTWTATVSYPPLPARIDHQQFVVDVRSDVDEVTGILIGDATGTNRVFLQVRNRGHVEVRPADVRALLLLARQDGAGNPPNLPAAWAARVVAGDATAWTGADWSFAPQYRPGPARGTTLLDRASISRGGRSWPHASASAAAPGPTPRSSRAAGSTLRA